MAVIDNRFFGWQIFAWIQRAIKCIHRRKICQELSRRKIIPSAWNSLHTAKTGICIKKNYYMHLSFLY